MTLAESNRMHFDAFVEVDATCEMTDIGLWHRVISSTDAQTLSSLMDRLTCSFPFEAKEIFVDNAFGYEVTLPRIIIN